MTACRAASTYPCPLTMHVTAGMRFRVYSLVCLAVVVMFNALTLAYAPAVDAGEPTPWETKLHCR
jgi:hypothetical protein